MLLANFLASKKSRPFDLLRMYQILSPIKKLHAYFFPLMVTGKMLCTYVHTYNVILWGLICQIVNEIKVILRSAKAYNVLRTFRNLRNVDIVTTLRKIAGVGNKS
jgi:hypothetical protein